MQKITVKEVKGPLGKGDKKFYAIKDSEGAEFTTFDKAIADLAPGSIIEAEVIVKGKYLNLGEWKLLEAGAAPARGNGAQGPYKRDIEGIRFEYELKAYLEQVKNTSIEGQTAFNGLVKLAELLPTHGNVIPVPLFEKAMQWAEMKLDASMAASKAVPEAAERAKVSSGKTQAGGKPAPKGNGEPSYPENIGQLLQWSLDNYGITRAVFMTIIGVDEAGLSKVNLVDAKQAIEDHCLFEALPSVFDK